MPLPNHSVRDSFLVFTPQRQHLSSCFGVTHFPDGCAFPQATHLIAFAVCLSSTSVCNAAALSKLITSSLPSADSSDLSENRFLEHQCSAPPTRYRVVLRNSPSRSRDPVASTSVASQSAHIFARPPGPHESRLRACSCLIYTTRTHRFSGRKDVYNLKSSPKSRDSRHRQSPRSGRQSCAPALISLLLPTSRIC